MCINNISNTVRSDPLDQYNTLCVFVYECFGFKTRNLKIARVLYIYIHTHTLQSRSGIALSSEQNSLEWDHSLWMRVETEEKRKKESRTRWRVGYILNPLPNYWESFPSITHSSFCVRATLFRNSNSISLGAISLYPILHEGMRKTVWHDYVSLNEWLPSESISPKAFMRTKSETNPNCIYLFNTILIFLFFCFSNQLIAN